MKTLITGVAGTGKSTIIKALQERGITAVDLHDVLDLFYWQDKTTKEKVEYKPVSSRDWFDTVDRFCDISKLQEILSAHDDIVVAGTASGNQSEILALFDKIIILQCDPKILVHRMETRVNKSGFGKTKAEQEDNIEWQKEFDPQLISLGAVSISSECTLDEAVEKIISEM